MKDLVSNCFLCGEKALHVAGTEGAQVMQCINCGYTTSTKFRGIKSDNDEFKKLGEDMKNWAKDENGYIWIPTVMALPIGMLYPINNKSKELKWSFAPMVALPEEDRKKYPNPNVPGKFYERKIDTDNATLYDLFLEGMTTINEMLKQSTHDGE